MKNNLMSKMLAIKLFSLLLLLGVSVSCVDEIDFETETFESALVIEATITDQTVNQEILLSRTFMFEEDGPNPEQGASVRIESDNGNFDFQEVEPGQYISVSPFSAQANTNYRLMITTSDGRSYSSTDTQLTQQSQVDQVYAVRETDDDGVNGMSIYVDSFDPTGNSKYYRYSYLESYKVVAPSWVDKDLIVTDQDKCLVEVIDRVEQQQVCFSTTKSIEYNLTTTTGLTEDRVERHLVRFIPSDDFILTHRYSILVEQFIQSREAFTYFETLNEFSGEGGSLFSQSQPGFFSGNIVSEANPLEKVIGFFDVSSVSSQRIFFNFEDFYAGEPQPPFFVSCDVVAPNQFELGGCGSLISEVLRNRVKYVAPNDTNPPIDGGPYLVVLRACGDCTALGENVAPDFWED